MAHKRANCKNHPERTTARRCFYCKEPICTECQHDWAHHRFCSRRCYYLWRVRQLFNRIPVSKEAFWIIGLLVLSDCLILWYVSHRTDRDTYATRETHRENVVDSARSKTSVSPPAVLIDSVRRPMRHMLQLRLKSPDKRMVALIRDGEITEARTGRADTILFSDIYLQRGYNRFSLRSFDAGGRSALIDSFTIRFRSGRIDYLSKPVDRVATDKKQVALTFDGGWQNRGAEALLDSLASDSVRCTMFLTGHFMRRYPQLVQRIAADGHEVGNHSLTHPHLTQWASTRSHRLRASIDRPFVYKQLIENDSLYRNITGRSMAPFWRAPFGEINDQLCLWAAEAGFKHIGWSANCDTRDWVADSTSNLFRKPQEIAEHLLRVEAEDGLQGSIILMHLGSERDGRHPYEILPSLVRALRARGYRFVKISQLLNEQGV